MRVLAIAVASALFITPVMAQQNHGINGVIRNLDKALNPDADDRPRQETYYDRGYDPRDHRYIEDRRDRERLDNRQRQLDNEQRRLNEERNEYRRDGWR